MPLAIGEMEDTSGWLEHHALQRASPLADLVQFLEDVGQPKLRGILRLEWSQPFIAPALVLDAELLGSEVVGATAHAVLVAPDLKICRRNLEHSAAGFVTQRQAAGRGPRHHSQELLRLCNGRALLEHSAERHEKRSTFPVELRLVA